jgi:hypothetical protein
LGSYASTAKTPPRLLTLCTVVHMSPYIAHLRELVGHIPDQDLESFRSIFSETLKGSRTLALSSLRGLALAVALYRCRVLRCMGNVTLYFSFRFNISHYVFPG